MRKALHQFSERHADLGEAQDSLFAATRMEGVEAAWICPEQRVHFITTCVGNLESLTPDRLQSRQRLVYLPEKPVAPVQPVAA